MSGFRDTFTKDEEQEGLLGYDDAAFLYFAGTILVVVAVPWTYNVIKSILCPGTEVEFGSRSRSERTCKSASMAPSSSGGKSGGRLSRSLLVQIGVLTGMWLCIAAIVYTVSGQQEIRSFDPFAILDVSSSASAADIKKAYRKLSLVYHPDKNPDNPLAVSRFIEITRAYNALTDETAKANYEKWGNPDGPQTSKVGIGLPRFLLEKDNQLLILCIFFFFLLFIVPMTAIMYYQRTKDYASNGVLIETLHIFASYVNDATRVKNCPELLAISGESRALPWRPTDNDAMKQLADEVKVHKSPQFAHWPVVMKNSYLILGHMQRLHHLMAPECRGDLDALLRHSVRIVPAMIDIACMREWFFTAQAMIEFMRCLVQGIDSKSSQLLQVPHFTEEHVKHVNKGKNGVTTIAGFLEKKPDERKGLASLEPEQVLDVEAFCEHMTNMDVTADVTVDDEDAICAGDIATVRVHMVRKNLNEGETAGPVHAPYFPEPKYEEWWVFLTEGSLGKIITFERVRLQKRTIEVKMRFQLTRVGKHRLEVHALSDSYAGLDQKVVLEFNVLHEDDPSVKREIIVHKEDEDLDLQPTLFQQFMGDFGHEEESEDEEEEEDEDKKKTKGKAAKAKPAGKDPGAAVGPVISEEGDERNAAAAEDDSSDSSSDSD